MTVYLIDMCNLLHATLDRITNYVFLSGWKYSESHVFTCNKSWSDMSHVILSFNVNFGRVGHLEKQKILLRICPKNLQKEDHIFFWILRITALELIRGWKQFGTTSDKQEGELSISALIKKF